MKWLLAAVLSVSALALAGAAFAQMPGTPGVPPCFTVFPIHEGPTEAVTDEHVGPLPLPCPVTGGFVVLLESADPALRLDLRNWSDVVAFTQSGPPPVGALTPVVWMLSDSPDPATGIENGITPADLAPIGVTPTDIMSNPTTVYIVEGTTNTANTSENDYVVPVGGVTVTYQIFSDPPEGPVPARPSTWGRLKSLYR